MAQLPIYTYNASVLRERTKEIRKPADDVIELVFDLFQTMHKASGIGLAANQVGRGISLCVIDLSEMKEEKDRHEPLVMMNPIITDKWGDMILFEEGCLSLPNVREEIERQDLVHVKFRDANFEPQELEAAGLLSRVIQHEVDHLNGIYFTDHLKGLKKKLINVQLNKIKKGQIEVDYPIAVNGAPVPA